MTNQEKETLEKIRMLGLIKTKQDPQNEKELNDLLVNAGVLFATLQILTRDEKLTLAKIVSETPERCKELALKKNLSLTYSIEDFEISLKTWEIYLTKFADYTLFNEMIKRFGINTPPSEEQWKKAIGYKIQTIERNISNAKLQKLARAITEETIPPISQENWEQLTEEKVDNLLQAALDPDTVLIKKWLDDFHDLPNTVQEKLKKAILK